MLPKEDIIYICIAVVGGFLSAITTMALKLHIKTLNLCCNVISLTRSVSSTFHLSKFNSSPEKSNSVQKNNDYI